MAEPDRDAEAMLDRLARRGWSAETPLEPLAGFAERVAAATVTVKRDDRLPALHGGSKVRKLDHLLAAAPWADARGWHAVGGIGSGHLASLVAAARELGRSVEVHAFWQEPSPTVLDNLAFTASGPTHVHAYRSRPALALGHPGLFLAHELGGLPVVPPGGTTPVAMVGMVRAGLELAAQVRAGLAPAPDVVYLALGTGGTATGLALGLALGGLASVEIRAVAVVEWPLATAGRLARLDRALRRHLGARGIAIAAPSCRVVIERGQVGAGYGAVTEASLGACRVAAASGLACEPTYTGRVMAALLAPERRARVRGRHVLVWHTASRPGLPHDPDWRARLPPALARRLAAAEAGARPSRRRVLVMGATAGAALALGGWRVFGGYREVPGWRGRVLSAREALIVQAAAEALLPPAPDGTALAGVAAAVDGYLAHLRPATRREVRAALLLVEHGTTPLGGRRHRLTDLAPPDRERFLAGLAARRGLLAEAYRGVRDLCFLGYYQDASSWPDLGYGGPLVPRDDDPARPPRPAWPTYDRFVAPADRRPHTWVGAT